MGRSPCCEKVGLKKGPWTPEEDQKLLAFIEQHGHGSWRALPAKAGLQRCGKSCRLRWTNYLRPDIKRGKFSLQEEQTIIQLHALLGNRWSAIATHLPKRTDNEIKNYWNTHLKKRLTKMGIDPVTHKPCSGSLCATTGLSHMAQWESARLEAEARLVRESKLLSSSSPATTNHHHPPQPSRPPCLDVLKAWQAQLGMLSSSPSCSSGVITKEAFSMIMALNGDHHLESPTSTLAFPYPMMTTTMVENAMIVQESKNVIPILPLNDDDDDVYENSSAWFGATGGSVAGNDEGNNNVVSNDHVTAVDGFPDFMARQYEQWSIKGETHSHNVGENYVGCNNNNQRGIDAEENKNYWNNILMNLVTINTSSASSLPSGSSPSRAVF